MPLYEFNCDNQECDKDTFEALTNFESSEPQRCPDCRYESISRKNFYQF